MSWTLAHNLEVRRKAILSCYSCIIYSIGDSAHQAEHSDHNPDATGVVHAIDVMLQAGTLQAAATLRWLLTDTADLEYVIHDRKIYSRSRFFVPAAYSGSDPHTNHIHVSGRHGSVGMNGATGTGYSLAAEAYVPKGTPCKPYVAPPPPVTPEVEVTKEELNAALEHLRAEIVHDVFHSAQFDPDPVTKKYTKSLAGKLDKLEAEVDGLYPTA